MIQRLSKIAKELKIGIATIAEFLNSNGYECDENPNEKLSADIIDFLKNNISAYVTDKQKSYDVSDDVQTKQQKKLETKTTEQIPLELKIIEAASKEKKMVERIIGFTDFDWHYTVAKFKGTCSQPIDLNIFDEILCDLLLIEQMSAKKIGNVLGLDIQTDPAEKEILLSAISELKRDKMIEGDESIYWLTDLGKEYAKNGVKFSTFDREFDLYIDLTSDNKVNIKNILAELKSEKQYTNLNFVPTTLNEIKALAEQQAPEIHFPKKKFFLQDAKMQKAESFKAKVWVILLENFRDNTVRAIVYDEKQDKTIDILSNALDKLEDEKQNLLEKLVKVNGDEDFVVEFTNEEKQEEQIAIENELIQKQEEFEVAFEAQNIEKIKEITNQASSIKRHFNSLEFEIELKRLFDETASDLWIISPWIKRYATERRIPFFEKYLRKGGRIFVAYSEPENETDIMADKETFNKLLELEMNYQNFYLHQLPKFHYKRVWIRNNGKDNFYYTGSYNILSFFVKQGLRNVRQEEMTKLDWSEENNNEYSELFTQFGAKYLNKAINDLNDLRANAPGSIDKAFLQKVKASDYGKLKPFINQGIDVFDEKYQELQNEKENNLRVYRELYVQSEIKTYKKEILELSKQTIPFEKKRDIQSRLNVLLNEFSDYSELDEIKEVAELIRNLKTFDFGKNKPNKMYNNKLKLKKKK